MVEWLTVVAVALLPLSSRDISSHKHRNTNRVGGKYSLRFAFKSFAAFRVIYLQVSSFVCFIGGVEWSGSVLLVFS